MRHQRNNFLDTLLQKRFLEAGKNIFLEIGMIPPSSSHSKKKMIYRGGSWLHSPQQIIVGQVNYKSIYQK